MDRFQKALVVINPASTRAARAKTHVRRLKALLPSGQVKVVPTSPDGPDANRTLIEEHQEHLGESSLLVVAAGDGTVNLIIEALLANPKLSTDARHTPVLPLWGGNANDLAHMLNGTGKLLNLPALLQSGRIVAIRPLSTRLTHPDTGTTTRIAASYVSFGASAAATQKLNEPDHRKDPIRDTVAGRAVSELAVVTKSMLEFPRFSLQDPDKTRLVYERLFLNGSRMAKTSAVPLKLTDNHFFQVTVEDKQAGTLAKHLLELANPATARNLATTKASFTTTEPTYAQFDGEPMQLKPNTQVEITLAAEPFYSLSRLL